MSACKIHLITHQNQCDLHDRIPVLILINRPSYTSATRNNSKTAGKRTFDSININCNKHGMTTPLRLDARLSEMSKFNSITMHFVIGLYFLLSSRSLPNYHHIRNHSFQSEKSSRSFINGTRTLLHRTIFHSKCCSPVTSSMCRLQRADCSLTTYASRLFCCIWAVNVS
jgi:hypothetical protein